MKTTRLNQLYEHLDHGDLLPYQEAELRALEKRAEKAENRSFFKSATLVALALIIATIYLIFNL